jgi:hypothetical protein
MRVLKLVKMWQAVGSVMTGQCYLDSISISLSANSSEFFNQFPPYIYSFMYRKLEVWWRVPWFFSFALYIIRVGHSQAGSKFIY